jgi:hypothetical protein
MRVGRRSARLPSAGIGSNLSELQGLEGAAAILKQPLRREVRKRGDPAARSTRFRGHGPWGRPGEDAA